VGGLVRALGAQADSTVGCRVISSATLVSATSRPRPITPNGLPHLAARSSNGSRPTPLGPRRRGSEESRVPRRCLRVQAIERLVKMRIAGRRGGPPRCRAVDAYRVRTCRLATSYRLQSGVGEHLIDAARRNALRVGEPEKVVASAATGLQRAGVDERPTWLSGWRRRAYRCPSTNASPRRERRARGSFASCSTSPPRWADKAGHLPGPT